MFDEDALLREDLFVSKVCLSHTLNASAQKVLKCASLNILFSNSCTICFDSSTQNRVLQ